MGTRSVLLAISALVLAMLACTKADDVQAVPTKLPTETAQIANIATSIPTATPHQHVCVEVAAGGNLHFRADPDETSTVLGWFPDGTVLVVYSPAGDWLLVEHGGVLGYIRRAYTKEVNCK